jgi:multidrug efflux pump subunit AcrA (membrane-fusion protein)
VKPRTTRWVFALLLLLAGGAVAFGFWWRRAQDADGADSLRKIARVVRRDFSSSVLATGAVRPQVGAEVRVGARISGKVERLHANIGDEVDKGQVIAELEKADLEAVVAQRQAELRLAEAKLSSVESLNPKEIAKAQTDVEQWQATVDLTESTFARRDSLYRNDEVGTLQDVEETQERLAVARSELAAANKALELAKARKTEERRQATAEIDRAEASLRNTEVQLSYATITAPISGVVGSVATQEGETVAAGLNAPTFVTIIDLSRLQVDAFVDEVDIGKVAPGQKAAFTVDAYPGREFEAEVVAIYPDAVIQENVVNYDVVLEIAGAYAGLLRPEMTASVTIFLDARKDVLAVPAKAVKREQGKSVVYIDEGEGPRAQEVTVGWKDAQWIEIVAGIEEQQTVLLEFPGIDATIR